MKLPYEYDALEPYIDAKTMEIHHSKHHQNYVNKFNAAIENSKLKDVPVEEILTNLNQIPEEIKNAVINNGGGTYNHNLFWTILKKDVPFDEESKIGEAILEKFGSFENFKKEFSEKASTLFGSGWTWLVLNKNNELEIIQTRNQDSVISLGMKPLLTLDVWEHAYYLKYQNKRPDYIEAFFNIINWDYVDDLFSEAKS